MYSFCVYIDFAFVSNEFNTYAIILEKYFQNRYERLQARYAAQIREKMGMVELPMQVIFDWPRNKPIAIKIKKIILKEMAHGMPIGRSTRIVVTDEIQARRDILVRMIES